MAEYFTAHINIKKITKNEPSTTHSSRTDRDIPTGRVIEDVLEVTVRAENYSKLAAKIGAIVDVEDQE